MRTPSSSITPPSRPVRRMAMWVTLALTSFFAIGTVFAAPASAATVTVCASGCSYTSIKAAVTAAAANDRIEVGAGTYNETSIVINKPLVIVGAGIGNTIIDGGGGVSSPAGIFRIQTGNFAAGAGAIQISEMTLTNASRTSASAPSFGITMVNSNASTGVSSIDLDKVAILGPNNRAAGGYGIYGVGGVTAGVDRAIPSFNFTNGTVKGQTNNGILLEDWKAAVTVSGSELHEGASLSSQSAFLAQSTQSAGRYLEPYTITGNKLFGSSLWFSGFFTGATPAIRGGFDSIIVTDNTMSGLSGNDTGINLGGSSGPAAAPAGSPDSTKIGTVIVRNNAITGDGLATANTTGVRVTGAADSVDVTENNLTGLRRGALVRADRSGSPTAVSITSNRIFADTTGVENTATTSVVATSNWWGCQAGPASASEFCSPVSNTGSGAIDTSTWIVTTAVLATNTPSVGSSTALTTNLITLNTGATIPAPSVFEGIPVVRTVDTGSVSPDSGSLANGTASDASYLAPADAGCGTLTVTVDQQVFPTRTVTGEPVKLEFCVKNPPVITSAAPGNGTKNESYTFTVTATGTDPISYTVSAGALPDGLTLNATAGVISGTASVAGTFNYTITATNVDGADSAEYTQDIADVVPPSPSPSTSPSTSPSQSSVPATTAPPTTPSTTTAAPTASGSPTSAPTTSAPSDLSNTGASISIASGLAVLIVLTGLALLIANHRRRARH